MTELRLLPQSEPESGIGDWVMRGGLAAFFILAGAEKFSSDPGSHWLRLFQEIGVGQWFRYFTGAVEIFGSLLLLVPRAALAGMIILSCTMASACLILTFIVHRPADSIFPGLFFAILIGMGWCRWKA